MTREEAITYLKVIWNRYKAEYEIERETLDAYNMAIGALQADPKHGKWINKSRISIISHLITVLNVGEQVMEQITVPTAERRWIRR